METHVFNEEKKRLEPIDNLCVFCGKGKSENQDDNFFIPLYKEGDRTNVVVYRKVSFKRIDIGLPRCPHCKKIHESQKRQLRIYTVLGGLLFFVVSFFIFDDMAFLIAILAAMVGALLALILSNIFIEKVSSKKHSILTKQEAAQTYGIVRGLLQDGWSFNQPQA